MTKQSSPIIIDALQCSKWDREVFEGLRLGGVTCIHVTCAIWEDGRATLDNLAHWYRLFRAHDDLIMPVERGADIEKAHAVGKTGVVLGFQNASPIENDLGLVEVFHRLGVRIMQLTYNNQSLLGGSCYEEHDSGLSRFGREVVREMNRVGMLIDLSHVGERTSLDAISASTRPVAITHANPYSSYPVKRSKSDTLLKVLAEHDGVLGCSLYPHFIGGHETTLAEFCEMIARTVDLIGIDHVGIGSDLVSKQTSDYLMWMRMGRWTHTVDYGAGSASQPAWPRWQDWFQSGKDFPNLIRGLREIGFSEVETAKIMGGNWLRFFGEGFEPA